MGPIGCPETSVRNYHYSLHNNPKERSSHVLTLWSRALLEKLTGFQVVKKFPAFYVTRRFITAFTSVRHLSYPAPGAVLISKAKLL
jgi:hypothetical protein